MEVCVVLFTPRTNVSHARSPFVSNTFDCGFLSVNPPAHTKMKLTPELEKILHRARAPNQLSIFLEKERNYLEWMMWHWYARKKSSWTKHSLLRQKWRVHRAIPWQRRCASKKFGPCAGRRLQRDAMVNLHPRQSKKTKYFLMK